MEENQPTRRIVTADINPEVRKMLLTMSTRLGIPHLTGNWHLHHVTLKYDYTGQEVRGAYPLDIILNGVGRTVSGVWALKVLIPSTQRLPVEDVQQNTHLTIFVPKGAEASDAGTITNWWDLPYSFPLKTRISEMTGHTPTIPGFVDSVAAHKWLYAMELEYADNFRFAYMDDVAGYEKYVIQRDSGCCGSVDRLIVAGGRPAMIGCNYGH